MENVDAYIARAPGPPLCETHPRIFANFSYSNRKEYIEWIEEAKTEETKNKRAGTAVDWIAEWKGRNWKYQE